MISRGYSNASHWTARLADGRSVFVKQAVDQLTAGWLRREFHVYQRLHVPWVPELLGWHDGELPILLLEDLSECDVAPPWTPARVDLVLGALAEMAAHPVPDGLPGIDDAGLEDGWPEVARDPEPLLSLGFCSADWLERALPVLLSAEAAAPMSGNSLVHLDVRSDNLFFRDATALLVDWNHAAVGNPAFDLAFWLPSLRMEGGPEPDAVASIDPGLLARVSGFFAARAGLPDLPTVPRVRAVQRRQLAIALPWAARALQLPPPVSRVG